MVPGSPEVTSEGDAFACGQVHRQPLAQDSLHVEVEEREFVSGKEINEINENKSLTTLQAKLTKFNSKNGNFANNVIDVISIINYATKRN